MYYVLLLDEVGNLLFSNQLFNDNFELASQKLAYHIYHEDQVAYQATVEQIIQQVQGSANLQLRFFKQAPILYDWLHCEFSLFTLSNTSQNYCLCVAHSIGHWKATEDKLRNNKQLLKEMSKMSHVGGWEFDIATQKVRWTDEMYNIYEVSPDYTPSITENLQRFYTESDVLFLREKIGKVLEEGSTEEIELTIKTAKGNYKYLQGIIRPQYNKEGKITKILGYVQDITKQRDIYNQLLNEKKKLSTIIETMQEGIVIQDMQGTILVCNPQAEQILGLRADQLKGRTSIDDRWRAVKEDGSPFLGQDHPAMVTLRTGEPQHNVIMGVHKPTGELTWIAINSQLLLEGTNHQPYGVLAVFHDITEIKNSQKSIKSNLDLLQNIINSSQDFIFVKDKDLRTIMCNTAFAQAVGKSPEQLMGKTDIEAGWLPELVYGNPEKGIKGYIHDDRAVLNGATVTIPVEPANVNGNIEFFETIKLPLKDKNHTIIGLVAIARNITERKKSEDKIREYATRLNEAQRLAKLGSWSLNLQTNELQWSDEVYRILEIPSQNVILTYEDFLQKVHPDDREMVDKVYHDSIVSRTKYDIVHRVLLSDERIKFVNEQCETFYDENNIPILSIGTIQDITASKEAEQRIIEQNKALNASEEELRQHLEELRVAQSALQEQKRYLEAITRSLDNSAIVTITDKQGIILKANHKFCEISKYEMHEIIGQDHCIVNSGYHPKTFWREMWQTIASGGTWYGEVRNKAKDGSYYWVYTINNPILDAEGNIYQYLSIRFDITAQKEAEEKVWLKNEQLSEIAYIQSHILRRPLANILGLIQLIEMEKIDISEELTTYLNLLIQAAKETDEVLHDIVYKANHVMNE